MQSSLVPRLQLPSVRISSPEGSKFKALRALNSAVECHLHTVEVIGSNPIAPTTLRFPALETWWNYVGWKLTSFCLRQHSFVVTSQSLQWLPVPVRRFAQRLRALIQTKIFP